MIYEQQGQGEPARMLSVFPTEATGVDKEDKEDKEEVFTNDLGLLYITNQATNLQLFSSK